MYTHSYTPTAKHAHSKSAWINQRWSCASQPNLRGKKQLATSARISPGEWVGHCWLPGNQFVCLLSWCFVGGYSSLQSARLGYAPLNGIYKTLGVTPPHNLYLLPPLCTWWSCTRAAQCCILFAMVGVWTSLLNTGRIHPSSFSWRFERWNKLCFLHTLACERCWAENLEVLKSGAIMQIDGWLSIVLLSQICRVGGESRFIS